ncbi:MAG TPA: Gfo/Idh/MocA family oxidoreductase [Gaiellaceae bacterium]|nr:Gfo/Idh/MocA family oxidoreductase [Gaiellaceae bacterium]
MNVGIVGCGVISRNYAEHAGAFDSFQVVACADLIPESAVELGDAQGLAVLSIDELLADPAIQVVLNLTPSGAHGAVTRAALEAGKHVYTEKPLAKDVAEGLELLALADARGLRIGCAPDIFLGSAYQAARALIDAGAIGEPLGVSAAMLVGGPNAWHPNPEQFFSDGAGPLLDMGPYYLTAVVALLGPVRRVAGFTSVRRPEREIMAGPRAGERFAVTTPTHASVAMELDGGVTVSYVASFEATARYICDFEIHGTERSLLLPDPNAFGGELRIRQSRGDWEEIRYTGGGATETRGIGLQDMVDAIAEGREHRASGRLGLHVIDAGRSILRAADEGRTVAVETTVAKPEPLAETADVARD